MHDIIEQHPEWQALKAQRHEVDLAYERHTKRVNAEQADYQRRLSEHTAARQEALLAGRPAPPAPTPPSNDPADAQVFLAELARCTLRERTWLATNAPDLEAVLAEREADLLAQATTLVGHLQAIGDEIQDLCGTTARVRAAADDQRPVHRRRVGAGDLVAAVEGHYRFLSHQRPEPETVMHSRPRPEPVDVAEHQPPAPYRYRPHEHGNPRLRGRR